MRRSVQAAAAIAVGIVLGCAGGSRGEAPAASAGGGDAADEAGTTTDGTLDVGGGTGSIPGEPSCTVVGELDATGDCMESAPPDSFDPRIQWTWTGPDPDRYSIVTPLVANLTDDNGDGAIDLCDVPDVLVLASAGSGIPGPPGHLYVLDGASGQLHFRIATDLDHTVTPAVGDIDGDGLVEIVAAGLDDRLVAFEHDGTPKWTGTHRWNGAYASAIALADLDQDGDVEILAGNTVSDDAGIRRWVGPAGDSLLSVISATTAADLDGDGDLEVVVGSSALHHDGSVYYQNPGVSPGYPQIADLDDDDEAEILVTNPDGISILEHDGATKAVNLRPTGDAAGEWGRPAAIHDFDGDGEPEFALSSGAHYARYRADATVVWAATVSDESGISSGTAFDFLGDGSAEAMYADEHFMFMFGEQGAPLMQIERTSGTLIEYPVVADIDNDGSAEIVVVSNTFPGSAPSPTVQVIRDAEDRWIQARRIWNQHAYHVTNVREDGTIPQFETPSWRLFNTFRTNAQIEGGRLCRPIPEG